MLFEDDIIDEVNIGKEKAKARRLRRSAWWMRKIREGRCYYCDRQVDPQELTMDHVVPLSRGGKSKKGNIVPACKECNNRKKYMLPIEWEEYIESLMEKKASI
jgi:5-methylcytosine-specific restriction protein A